MASNDFFSTPLKIMLEASQMLMGDESMSVHSAHSLLNSFLINIPEYTEPALKAWGVSVT